MKEETSLWPILLWGSSPSPHLSLSSAAFSASSSFCSAVPSLSCARSNSSSTSWILRFRAATSASAWKQSQRSRFVYVRWANSHVWKLILNSSYCLPQHFSLLNISIFFTFSLSWIPLGDFMVSLTTSAIWLCFCCCFTPVSTPVLSLVCYPNVYTCFVFIPWLVCPCSLLFLVLSQNPVIYFRIGS